MNVTLVPAQIAPDGVAPIPIAGTTEVLTVIVTVLLTVTTVPAVQPEVVVNSQVIISPLAGAVNV